MQKAYARPPPIELKELVEFAYQKVGSDLDKRQATFDCMVSRATA